MKPRNPRVTCPLDLALEMARTSPEHPKKALPTLNSRHKIWMRAETSTACEGERGALGRGGYWAFYGQELTIVIDFAEVWLMIGMPVGGVIVKNGTFLYIYYARCIFLVKKCLSYVIFNNNINFIFILD